MRGDASCDGGVRGINGNGVSGAVRVGIMVPGDHLRKGEDAGEGWGKRRADEAGGVADHEGHFFGCEGGGGDDEVAFIFAGGGIEDDDEVAVFCEGGRGLV